MYTTKRICAMALVLRLVSAVVAADLDPKGIEKQAARLRSSDTGAWRKIPWAGSLTAAARVASAEGRPMFLFSHEGNIDTGRC